jgi:hypothetical protein
LTNNRTINEFNRFILHLVAFLNTLENEKAKENYIVKIKGLIDKKYNEVCLYDTIIYFQNFNDFCAITTQLYELVHKCINENLINNQDIFNDLLNDVETKIVQLRKINRWTVPSRYGKHFIYLPQKPRQFFKETLKNVELLKQKLASK